MFLDFDDTLPQLLGLASAAVLIEMGSSSTPSFVKMEQDRRDVPEPRSSTS